MYSKRDGRNNYIFWLYCHRRRRFVPYERCGVVYVGKHIVINRLFLLFFSPSKFVNAYFFIFIFIIFLYTSIYMIRRLRYGTTILRRFPPERRGVTLAETHGVPVHVIRLTCHDAIVFSTAVRTYIRLYSFNSFR